MFISSIDLLKDAKERGYAVPAANFINFDSAKAYIKTAEKNNLPLILAFAQAHKDLLSLKEAAVIGTYLAENAKVPVVLHLDHGEDKEFIMEAIDLGFKSVMIDASSETFEDNIKITKEVVDYAHSKNVCVEAELGHVGSGENYEDHDITDSIYTEVDDVIEFVEKTKIDSLAVSIGTAHGTYSGTPKLNFERLEEISKVTDIPLVLHGGSSTGDDNLNRCATSGISKINIFTDFLNAAINNVKDNDPKDYISLRNYVSEGISKTLDHYYEVFNTKEIKTKGR